LHGAPAEISGFAAEARSPTISHANDATVAERNDRREDFLPIT